MCFSELIATASERGKNGWGEEEHGSKNGAAPEARIGLLVMASFLLPQSLEPTAAAISSSPTDPAGMSSDSSCFKAPPS